MAPRRRGCRTRPLATSRPSRSSSSHCRGGSYNSSRGDSHSSSRRAPHSTSSIPTSNRWSCRSPLQCSCSSPCRPPRPLQMPLRLTSRPHQAPLPLTSPRPRARLPLTSPPPRARLSLTSPPLRARPRLTTRRLPPTCPSWEAADILSSMHPRRPRRRRQGLLDLRRRPLPDLLPLPLTLGASPALRPHPTIHLGRTLPLGGPEGISRPPLEAWARNGPPAVPDPHQEHRRRHHRHRRPILQPHRLPGWAQRRSSIPYSPLRGG